MKSIFSILNSSYSGRQNRNIKIIVKLLFFLALLVTVYSFIFQYLMQLENQQHSWISAVYWCLVVMSTLGFGDITFHTDIGRAFSILVLISGTFFMLILLPFFFIQFFFVPWMESQASKRAPRKVAPDLKGHVILTGLGEIERALIKRLNKCKVRFVVIVPDISEALLLNDEGIPVIVGDLDDSETYHNANVADAALVVSTNTDTINSNISFTVREISPNVPIVATASVPASVDILELAGCNRVLQLGEMLGNSFSRRIIGKDGKCHIIGEFSDLIVAEAIAMHPELINKPLKEVKLRDIANVTITGTWERGKFELAGPETILTPSSAIILSGSREQLSSYDSYFGIKDKPTHSFILILGGGKVGRAVARELELKNIDYRIIDKDLGRIRKEEKYTFGDAAEIEVLKEAGIDKATSILVTTHDDAMNVYLTIYCRKLRSDVQLISRSNTERNITTLHKAGADFVLSYAAIGANALFNLLQRMDTVLIAEGLSAFRVAVPSSLVNKTLRKSALRESTGCSVIAIIRNGEHEVNPDPDKSLEKDSELIIMGDSDAEERFMKKFTFDELNILDRS
ncbi:MAG TPA: NAD-binding protein [Oligoflexia bacterium]|nr:NAD-binding protein [Oligoflexia bacterium]HMP47625.1 NAD-binding protein [Oligoflexia bacterium]